MSQRRKRRRGKRGIRVESKNQKNKGKGGGRWRRELATRGRLFGLILQRRAELLAKIPRELAAAMKALHNESQLK